MPTRREILTKLGVGAASTAAMGAGGVALATHHATLEALGSSTGQAPWWLIHPLHKSETIGLGWSVSNMGPVHQGAAILELSHRTGQTARVHICTYEGKPKGLAHTALFDLILMDGGRGDKPTEETIGRVLLTLADIIAENEIRDEADLSKVTRMLTHTERVELYGPETLT